MVKLEGGAWLEESINSLAQQGFRYVRISALHRSQSINSVVTKSRAKRAAGGSGTFQDASDWSKQEPTLSWWNAFLPDLENALPKNSAYPLLVLEPAPH